MTAQALRAACPTPPPANVALPALVPGWWTKPHKECQGLAVPTASRLWAQGTGKAWPRTLSEGLCEPREPVQGNAGNWPGCYGVGTPLLLEVQLPIQA